MHKFKPLFFAVLVLSLFAAWYYLREPSFGAEHLAGSFASHLYKANYSLIDLPPEEYAGPERLRRSLSTPDRRAFFGDMHVHTSYSFDSYSMGVLATPADAYRYARGEPLKHPAGFDMQLRQPLDFYAVTDHAMFLGLAREAGDPTSEYSTLEVSRNIRGINEPSQLKTGLLNTLLRAKAFADFLPTNVDAIESGEVSRETTLQIARSAWEDTIKAARDYNNPGVFTTFVAYEYTSMASDAGNLHRNVIFSGTEHLPAEPFSTMHSENPEDLWDWMDVMRERGVDSLAIPHNSNGSNGHMFEMTTWNGSPMDSAYVAKRRRNEPVVEITQIKGTSETHPTLSPDDEWAGFEITNQRVASYLPSEPHGSYVREALQRGLMLGRGGVGNPYDFGVIGSSDTHNAASGIDEEDFVSKLGLLSSDGKRRGSVPLSKLEGLVIKLASKGMAEDVDGRDYMAGAIPTFGASGLAGVWAEENTREAIFSAFKRKETFATSGPRIKLRFFAGYGYGKQILNTQGAVHLAYKRGVAMGGVLPIRRDASPEFFVWAIADPNSAPLQRIQIVKGWIDRSGQARETVIDVACAKGLVPDAITHRCPESDAWVDMDDCSYNTEAGSAQLKAVWQDSEFDAEEPAFYYARVLENPTCRWSTWDAIRAGASPRPDLPATIQERAWSSAIQMGGS